MAHTGPAYVQSIDGCLASAIGTRGPAREVLAATLANMAPLIEGLQEDHRTGRLAVLTIPMATADIASAEAAYTRLVSGGARTVVFFGTGGSALGGETLAQLAGWNIPGGGDPTKLDRPRTRFYDNLDPLTLQGALAMLDLATTRFIVTSKSGGTAETLAQAIVAISAVRAAGLGDKIPSLFLGVTEPAVGGKSNGLRSLFESLGVPLLDHHASIGGRYSCLTNVGLLAAIARGLDARAIRAGAQEVIGQMLAAKKPEECAPALGAAVTISLARSHGIRTLVMMPYADRLGMFARWFVQLWAESIGKQGQGTSPIAALGPLDQHSQLQLFMEGPYEHMITIVRHPTAGAGPRIDAGMARTAGLPYIGGKTVGDIVQAQSAALPEALREAGRPVRTFDMAALDERCMGAMLMHFMIETILSGRLMGIDPFDQPGVELAKKLTKARLSAG